MKIMPNLFLIPGKKRKAKDSKKGGKKKKKRKADSDASEGEFDGNEEEEFAPKSAGRGSAKRGAAGKAASGEDGQTVEEVCSLYGLNDVDLEYTDADYQNLTTSKLFMSTYKPRIQAANPKVNLIFFRLNRTQCQHGRC